jgi:hypothetical protein
MFERGAEAARIDSRGPLLVQLGGATGLAADAAVGDPGVVYLFEDGSSLPRPRPVRARAEVPAAALQRSLSLLSCTKIGAGATARFCALYRPPYVRLTRARHPARPFRDGNHAPRGTGFATEHCRCGPAMCRRLRALVAAAGAACMNGWAYTRLRLCSPRYRNFRKASAPSS